jgi:hypothetical protein
LRREVETCSCANLRHAAEREVTAPPLSSLGALGPCSIRSSRPYHSSRRISWS